jgi:hypothetical protein
MNTRRNKSHTPEEEAAQKEWAVKNKATRRAALAAETQHPVQRIPRAVPEQGIRDPNTIPQQRRKPKTIRVTSDRSDEPEIVDFEMSAYYHEYYREYCAEIHNIAANLVFSAGVAMTADQKTDTERNNALNELTESAWATVIELLATLRKEAGW